MCETRDTPRYEVVGADDPVTRMAHAISGQAFQLAAQFKMSRFDVCVAMANACGHILADNLAPPPEGVVMPKRGKAMPREAALERMDSLREVMQAAYDMRDIKGGA